MTAVIRVVSDLGSLTASGKNTGEDQVETGPLLSCFQLIGRALRVQAEP